MDCILDKKSGHVEPWAALQTAAYTLLDTPAQSFDEAEHAYHHNGVRLPSVTQILQAEGFIDMRFFDAYSRERGRLVHLATHYDDMGELDEDTLDPVIEPYLRAWRKFRQESGFTVESSEVPMVNIKYGFAGTPDVRGRFPKGALRRGAVELHDDGTYKLYQFPDRNDVNVWLAALACHTWKTNNRR